MKIVSRSLLLAGFLALVGTPAVHAQSFLPDEDPALVPALQMSGFGTAVAVSGEQVLVTEAETSIRPGAVHLYERGADGSWSVVGEITAPDANGPDGFGSAMAVEGDRMVVGAAGSNRAWVAERTGGEWVVVAELEGSETDGSAFGAAVSLHGEMAAVGAPQAGAVHLFSHEGGSWSEVTRIEAPEGAGSSGFGGAVLLRDGEVLAGAPMAEERAGTVFAYRQHDGEWVEAGSLTPRNPSQNAMFGARLALHGNEVVVGAPNHGTGGGAFFFRVDDSGTGWVQEARLQAFDGTQGIAFGAAFAVAGDELWVGVPQISGRQGAIDRFIRTDDGFEGVHRLRSEEGIRNAGFGSAIAVDGDLAAVTLGGADNGAGVVAIFERGADDVWTEAEILRPEPESFPAIVAESVMCEDGSAAGFDCENIEILSFLPIPDIGGERGIRLNDTWGWHDEETGREIVLVGRTDGTAFVDITDPVNPVYLGEVLRTDGSPTAAWRDFKVFRDHAFIVADASGQHGMQIFNLRRLDEYDGEPITWEPDLTYDRINSAHNIGLNAETGHVYIVGASAGGETCGGGLHMVDVNDPLNPEFAGCFADPQTGRTGTGYSHDVQCVTYHGPDERYQGREICMGSNETHLSIADVTDKSDPVAVSRLAYPNVGYVHQGWFDEDHQYFYMQDELALMQGLIDNTRTIVIDATDLEDPQVVNEYFFDSRAISHNLYIVGDLMYEANYASGLRILDISDRENPLEVGYIDTAPTHEQEPMFEGAWSTYPFFESGSISVSSIGEGLFIVRFHDGRPVS